MDSYGRQKLPRRRQIAKANATTTAAHFFHWRPIKTRLKEEGVVAGRQPQTPARVLARAPPLENSWCTFIGTIYYACAKCVLLQSVESRLE
eukprot:3048108-Amphidinium_carterae.1